jgi:next-to-BRCA1 protein 1
VTEIIPTATEVDDKPKSNLLGGRAMSPQYVNDYAKKMEELQKVLTSMLSRDAAPSRSAAKTFYHQVPTSPKPDSPPRNSWSVYCNSCEKNMLKEHYHCNVCDGGDYDLCPECVDAGVHCPGDNHWLIKRVFNENGTLVTSTTEKAGPKSPKLDVTKEMPGAFTEEKTLVTEKKPEPLPTPTRTCNCCVKVYPESAFVTCNDCEDYDLCLPCLELGKHGHHPAHKLQPATHSTALPEKYRKLCKPGRHASHAAICDNCDKVSNSLHFIMIFC